MKFALTAILACLMTCAVDAQTRRPPSRNAAPRSREIGQMAYVMDETLSVLRPKPSLFAVPMQRMRRGRVVKILGVAEADGVKFYRVAAIPTDPAAGPDSSSFTGNREALAWSISPPAEVTASRRPV